MSTTPKTPKPRALRVHTLASLTERCAEEGDCLIWPGVGPQRKKITRVTIHHAGVRQSVRRLFAALRGDPQALAEQAGQAERGYWVSTCGDPHCMAAAHTQRRSQKQHLTHANTLANSGAVNRVRIAKISRVRRQRHGKLTDEQIEAIRRSPLGIEQEAQRYGVSAALISRVRRRNPATAAGTVWAGLGGRASA